MNKPEEPRLSRWGVGPRIMIPSLISAVLAGVASRYWSEVCVVHSVPRLLSIVGGILLVVVGLTIWLIAVSAVMRAYNDDRLVTSGIFGWVRNPIYSAWIVFIFPGIAMLCRSWPLLLPAFVGYVLFRQLIHRENEYLENRYGDAYRVYKAEVNALIPFLRKKQ